MKKNKVIEAWRNEEYYLSLSDEERAGLPAHPSGPTGLEDEILRSVTGGCGCTGCVGCTSGFCTPCGTKVCQA